MSLGKADCTANVRISESQRPTSGREQKASDSTTG